MMAKPMKTLELHHTMEYLIIQLYFLGVFTHESFNCFSLFIPRHVIEYIVANTIIS